MSKKSIEGQMDLFSLIDTADIYYDDNELPTITMSENVSSIEDAEEPENISSDSPAEPPNLREDLSLDLEEGDVIWAVIDKKIESHIVIKAKKNYCITQSGDGQKRRLTGRSKGIVWETTREQAQRLCDKHYK